MWIKNMIFKNFCNTFAFCWLQRIARKSTVFNKDWEAQKTIFSHFSSSIVSWSGTLIPFKSMSMTLSITFLFFWNTEELLSYPRASSPRVSHPSTCPGSNMLLTKVHSAHLHPPQWNTLLVLNSTVRLHFKIYWKPDPLSIFKGLFFFYSVNTSVISKNSASSRSFTAEINISTNITVYFGFCHPK